jgi:predicted SAM-dependent methyltransferase
MNIIQSSRSAARRALTALGHRLWPLARKRVEQRLGDLERQIPPLRAEVDVARQRQTEEMGRLTQEVGSLFERIEFMRREILYEMKFGQSAAPEPIVARTLQPEKLAEAYNKGLRLNLGCGHVALPDYINVDQRDLPGVDIVADLGNLPLREASAQELYSSHVLEHFSQEDLRRRLLPYWRSLMTSKGLFRAVVPDGETMLARLSAGTYPFEDFREVLFGAQEYVGDFHYNLFTPDSLHALLEEAGYVDIEIPFRGRRNGKCFDFEVRAKRP